MAFNRDYEIARPSAVPYWLQEFAEDALRRSANGSNPFQEIKSLFQRNKDLGAIETRVRELKDRIGLNLLADYETEESPTIKTASIKSSITRLIRLANWLDKNGSQDEAKEIDSIIHKRAVNLSVNKLFEQYPKLKIFIDNVIKSRKGHVVVPALIKMIRDERPEDSQAASDPSLQEYMKSRIGEEKQEISDSGDNVAGLGVGLSTSQEEINEGNKMFEPSKPS